jgi:hypothetical protein
MSEPVRPYLTESEFSKLVRCMERAERLAQRRSAEPRPVSGGLHPRSLPASPAASRWRRREPREQVRLQKTPRRATPPRQSWRAIANLPARPGAAKGRPKAAIRHSIRHRAGALGEIAVGAAMGGSG